MVQKFCLISEPYLTKECHIWFNGSVWHRDWPHKIYVRQWPIFCGPVTLLNTLETIWWRNVILEITSVWHKDWTHKLYVCQWPIFCCPVILLNIFQDYLMEKCHTWDNGSVWHKDWTPKIYIGQWPIFGLISWRLFDIWWMNIILGIMDQCDTMIDLIKYM